MPFHPQNQAQTGRVQCTMCGSTIDISHLSEAEAVDWYNKQMSVAKPASMDAPTISYREAQAMVLAERERCAKAAETMAEAYREGGSVHGTCMILARSIREGR